MRASALEVAVFFNNIYWCVVPGLVRQILSVSVSCPITCHGDNCRRQILDLSETKDGSWVLRPLASEPVAAERH